MYLFTKRVQPRHMEQKKHRAILYILRDHFMVQLLPLLLVRCRPGTIEEALEYWIAILRPVLESIAGKILSDIEVRI